MKDIRHTLPDDVAEQFERQKRKAEQEIGMTLRDNEFATRVLTQAIKMMEKAG